MRLLDVRHEQTAAFAAEATGKLTRVPGLAVLTAGPGVTNGVSAIAQAQFAGSPMVVVGGRAPANRWGSGSLQELDQPPIVESVSKLATTLHTADAVLDGMDDAFRAAGSSHRGPVFVDVPMDEFFNSASGRVPAGGPASSAAPDPDAISQIASLLAQARRPVLVLGTDVWADRAETAALRFVEEIGVPTITNGMGRGIVPGGHPMLVTKARSQALGGADLVVVVGTPARLPARLRRLRWQGGGQAVRRASCTSPTPTASSPATPTSPPRPPATSRWSSTRCRPRSRAAPSPTGRGGSPTFKATSRRAWNATERCSPPMPTPSTPPASTASWCPVWPRTRS